MRKKNKIALLLALSLVIGIQSPYGVKNEKNVVKAEEQLEEESDILKSKDGLSFYRELEDGTISLIYFNGELVKNEDENLTKLVIPNEIDGKQVTELEGTLLDNNSSRESINTIVLPKALKEIDITLFRYIFYLNEILIDEGNEYFTTKDGVLYNKDSSELIRVPEAGQVEQDSNVFEVPDTVKEIGSEAFFNCYGMNEITISKNVESIGELVFYRYISSYRYFTFKVDSENKCFTADEDGSLFSKDMTILYRYAYHVSEDESSFFNFVTYKIPDTVTEIGSTAFQGCIEYSSFGGLLYVEFPENLTKIGSNAFDGCSYLGDKDMAAIAGNIESVDIIIPDSVTEIGTEAFKDCTFETIVLPKSLQEIQAYTFCECNNLKEIVVPENVKKISDNAFVKCTALNKVECNDKLETIGDFAFYNCTSLTLLEIGSNVTEIGQYALGYTVGDEENKYILVDDVTILCKQGSAADKYALDNGITVKYFADVTPTPPTSTSTAFPTETPTSSPSASPAGTPDATAVPSNTPSNVPPVDVTAAPNVTPGVEPEEQPAAVKKLGKVKLVSVVNKKKHKMVVTIKKAENATGYVVQYAKTKKFKNAKNVVISKKSVQKITLKNLKKKTYYVRVRAFRKSDKGMEYSSWSKAKKVKVKK